LDATKPEWFSFSVYITWSLLSKYIKLNTWVRITLLQFTEYSRILEFQGSSTHGRHLMCLTKSLAFLLRSFDYEFGHVYLHTTHRRIYLPVFSFRIA
jgi:hypothetical protein